jgi:hypothetical protein
VNKHGILVAIAMFVLGTVVGHSVSAPATVDGKTEARSAFDLMKNAPGLADTTTHEAI